MTLSTYAHLFDEQDHGVRIAPILEVGFGGTIAAMSPKPQLALVAG